MKRGTGKKILAVLLSVGTITGNFAWSESNVWAAVQTEGQEEQQPGDGSEEGQQPGDGSEEGQQPGDGNEEGKQPGDANEEEQGESPDDQNSGNTSGSSTEASSYSLTEDQILQHKCNKDSGELHRLKNAFTNLIN